MATIAEIVGYVIAGVAFLNTFVQIIWYLSDEELREKLWTWIKGQLVAAPAPVPNPVINNNQTYYHYTFTKPCPITINLGNGQAPAFDQIQGYCLDRTAHRVAPTLPSTLKPLIAYEAAPDTDSDTRAAHMRLKRVMRRRI